MPHQIVNVGYKSTNFWVVSAGRSRLLVDLGWPGTFGALKAQLDRMDIPLAEIAHGLATHYHLDHAGAAQELKLAGMRLVVLDVQQRAINGMLDFAKPADRYTAITLHDNTIISCANSRAFLATLGLAGEVVHTPGHSDDSVSLLLDDGAVFTGDLTWPTFITPEEADVTNASWALLRAKGASTVYAGHGPVRPMPAVGDG